MRALYVVLGLAAVAVPGVAWAMSRREPLLTGDVALDALKTPSAPGPAGMGALIADSATTQAAPGVAVVEPQAPSAGLGKVIQTGVKFAAGSSAAATVGVGLTVARLQGAGVALMGGSEAQQDAARVFGPAATAAVAAQRITETIADRIGVPDGVARTAGQASAAATAAGLVLGGGAAVGALIGKGVGELGSAAIGAILGERTEQAVRSAVSEPDPFKTGSLAHDVVSGIGRAIFGGPASTPTGPTGVMSIEEQVLRVESAITRANTEDRKRGINLHDI